ncbi:MAG: hypothetical protein AAF846_15610 [Chloroflexota bacterium]
MSQNEQPTQQNNRPRRELYNNQPRTGYERPAQPSQQQTAYPQQEAQYPPQGRPMPPRSPQAPQNQSLPQRPAQAMPTSQPSQPEKIYVERKSNPVMMVIKVITFPFVKLVQMIVRIITIIIEELVRSLVSFIFGVILLLGVLILLVGYGYALVQVDFNFVEAIPEMFRIFRGLLGF